MTDRIKPIMSNFADWEKYYQITKAQDIPWKGVIPEYFEELWKRFKLPQKGNLLDVGCGTGDKAIYFAKKGVRVWGFDISPTAIRKAKLASKNLKNKPVFAVGDALKLGKIKEIRGLKFDVVLDKLTSQFLSNKEKLEFLRTLRSYLKPDAFFILQCFGKDNPVDRLEGLPDWIREIALAPEEVEQIYGSFFKILSRDRKITPEGRKLVTYVMQAK